VIESSLLRRALVGMAIFAAMVVLGVVLAAGGDQGARRKPARHLTATSAVNDGRSRRRAAESANRGPNPRAPRPRGAGSRSNPL
jgi:hypothetical protein